MPVFWDKSLIAVPDAQNIPHVIPVVKLQDYAPDDIVDSGTQAAAGHNCGLGLGWVEIDHFAGTGYFEGDGAAVHIFKFVIMFQVNIKEKPVVIVFEIANGNRRGDISGSEIWYCEMLLGAHQKSSGGDCRYAVKYSLNRVLFIGNEEGDY
jgi:hypothetical protein